MKYSSKLCLVFLSNVEWLAKDRTTSYFSFLCKSSKVESKKSQLDIFKCFFTELAISIKYGLISNP